MTILAILVRHAKVQLTPTEPDSTPRISESGRKMQAYIIDVLKDFGVQPTEIWTSPVVRAVETAELIGNAFAITPQQEVALGELEMFDELEVTNRLATVADGSTIILVSHAPQIVRLTSYWLGGRAYSSSPPTSSATLIEFPNSVAPGKGQFVRLISYSG